jgi:ribonuclease-3
MQVEKLSELQDRLGYRFKDPSLLQHALTHKSYANEYRLGALGHNERLEFLGDTVLDFVISDIIMRLCPTSPEGELSKIRAVIVSEGSLSRSARELELGGYLLLGRGEEQTGGREKPSLLANAFEAIVAAMYLDGGLEPAYCFLQERLEDNIKSVTETGQTHDFKTELQERCQSAYGSLPRYQVVGESGPDHQKVFEVEIEAGGRQLGRGVGKSKKEAEQEAAREALERLKLEG